MLDQLGQNFNRVGRYLQLVMFGPKMFGNLFGVSGFIVGLDRKPNAKCLDWI